MTTVKDQISSGSFFCGSVGLFWNYLDATPKQGKFSEHVVSHIDIIMLNHKKSPHLQASKHHCRDPRVLQTEDMLIEAWLALV